MKIKIKSKDKRNSEIMGVILEPAKCIMNLVFKDKADEITNMLNSKTLYGTCVCDVLYHVKTDLYEFYVLQFKEHVFLFSNYYDEIVPSIKQNIKSKIKKHLAKT